MRHSHAALALLAVAALVASPAMVAPATAQSGGIPTEDHVFSYGQIPGDFEALVAAAGGAVVRRHDAIGVAVTSGLSDAQAATIAGDNPVARDYMVQWQPPIAAVAGGIVELTDPSGAAHDPTAASLFANQWDMRIIDADDAWNAGFTGNPNSSRRTGLGQQHLTDLDGGVVRELCQLLPPLVLLQGEGRGAPALRERLEKAEDLAGLLDLRRRTAVGGGI